MNVNDIKSLPKEFDFRSNINPFGILYHAKEHENGYKVTCDCEYDWNYSKAEMRRRLLKGDYVIIK